MSLKKVVDAINQNKTFLLTTHTSPEGDALGSQLALAMLLEARGKQVIIINEDRVPKEYIFLPGINNIRRKIRNLKFDVAIFVDCADKKRAGNVAEVIASDKIIVNIDHHISNVKFADVNWVEPRAAATVELIFKLFKEMRVPLNKDSALLLYVGLLTDTGSFRYANTTHFTHEIAAELLKHGLNANEIYRNIYQSFTFSEVKLLNAILSDIKRDESARLVWFEVRKKLLSGEKLDFDLTDSVMSFGRSIKGVEVVAMFKENLGANREIRVNLRSQGRVDVNKVARCFGGGGHKTASGATIKGTLSEVRDKVLKKIRCQLK